MKRIFLLFGAVALACSMQAKSLTLDWSAPLNPTTFTYDATDTWTGTYNEDDYYTIDFQGMSFAHNAWEDYDFWYGFTVAKSAQTTYAKLTDQFRCVAGGGLAGTGTPYILAYAMEGMGPTSPCEVYFTADNDPWIAKEVYLCNGAWTYENIVNGGSPARAFAAGDSLVVEIEGLDDEGEVISGKKVTFFLADYRSANQADWKINKTWEKVDLTALGEVYGLVFTMKTSDRGTYGANTALYFGLDGLTIERPEVVAGFEDITLAKADTVWQGADAPALGWNNWTSGTYNFQSYNGGDSGYGAYYSAFTVSNQTANTYAGLQDAYHSAAGGAYAGENFVVWNMNYYGADTVTFEPQVVPGMFINNTAYAVSSMVNGDSFAKKFGKDDWFKLTIYGGNQGEYSRYIEVYLAQDGKYINQWTWVDLSNLGKIDGILFEMSSSDASEWGMNTPAYFCMDNFGAAMPEGYVAPAMAEFPSTVDIENTNAAIKAVKVIRNGQVVIIREGKAFNILGTEL